MKLNVGCGSRVLDGFINIDFREGPGVDLVLDLDHDVLPFEDASVDSIFASHILEHVAHLERVLSEFHRVLVPRGFIEVYSTPTWRKSWNHLRGFSRRMFHSLDEDSTSLHGRFRLASFEVSASQLPFAWHAKKYLHVKVPQVGIPIEVHFVLEKIGGG